MREPSLTLTRMGRHPGSLEALRITRPKALVLAGSKDDRSDSTSSAPRGGRRLSRRRRPTAGTRPDLEPSGCGLGTGARVSRGRTARPGVFHWHFSSCRQLRRSAFRSNRSATDRGRTPSPSGRRAQSPTYVERARVPGSDCHENWRTWGPCTGRGASIAVDSSAFYLSAAVPAFRSFPSQRRQQRVFSV